MTKRHRVEVGTSDGVVTYQAYLDQTRQLRIVRIMVVEDRVCSDDFCVVGRLQPDQAIVNFKKHDLQLVVLLSGSSCEIVSFDRSLGKYRRGNRGSWYPTKLVSSDRLLEGK